jgi:uncharacterized protein YdhG (YjbR/CyaY superfamily)
VRLPHDREYIAVQKPDSRARLHELCNTIHAPVSETTEIISYGMPTYRLAARRAYFRAVEAPLCAVRAAIDLVADDLGNLRTLKGTVQFPFDGPRPRSWR